jgi:hypothetical protein
MISRYNHKFLWGRDIKLNSIFWCCILFIYCKQNLHPRFLVRSWKTKLEIAFSENRRHLIILILHSNGDLNRNTQCQEYQCQKNHKDIHHVTVSRSKWQLHAVMARRQWSSLAWKCIRTLSALNRALRYEEEFMLLKCPILTVRLMEMEIQWHNYEGRWQWIHALLLLMRFHYWYIINSPPSAELVSLMYLVYSPGH